MRYKDFQFLHIMGGGGGKTIHFNIVQVKIKGERSTPLPPQLCYWVQQ